jgi:CheY-like chemotaxis protein
MVGRGGRSYSRCVVLRCLIVDDNLGFLEAARALLEQEGFVVVGVASTGAEATCSVAELQPEVTLVDIDLGEESGFDVARRLIDDPERRRRRPRPAGPVLTVARARSCESPLPASPHRLLQVVAAREWRCPWRRAPSAPATLAVSGSRSPRRLTCPSGIRSRAS